MTYRVVITQKAEDELQANARWWATERSPEQASRWLSGFQTSLASLAEFPRRCQLATENGLQSLELRELHFGLMRHTTHRAVFTIVESADNNSVIVLTIRHAARDRLKLKDLLE